MSRFLNRFLYLGVLAVAVAGILVGCGGKDGATGPAGPPGTAECMQCHTDDYQMTNYLLAVKTEYEDSQHARGDTWEERGNTTTRPCSRCHTTEGYQGFVETGQVVDVQTSSPIGCFACHAPHTNKNFDLRKVGATVLDVGGGSYDKEGSNTCAMCHQSRVPNPAIADTATAITSSRWGPHHATQANILLGNGAYVFGGAAYSAGHQHNTGIGDGCVKCHMAGVPQDNLAGGHTFKVAYGEEPDLTINAQKACVTCHESWASDDDATAAVESAQAAFEARLAELKGLLVERGWINDATNLVNASTSNPLRGLAPSDRGAIFNYLLMDGDPAHGVHNPTYTSSVMNATIAYMQGK